MREIKFRGKRQDNGKWIYGYYRCIQWEIDKYSHEIINGNSFFRVDPETVGQFTNKIDTHEKDIYEGDKVSFTVFDAMGSDNLFEGIVKFAGGQWQIWNNAITEFYGPDGAFDLNWVVSQDDEIEIIGNIHENKTHEEKVS